jgi:hypothetical protein
MPNFRLPRRPYVGGHAASQLDPLVPALARVGPAHLRPGDAVEQLSGALAAASRPAPEVVRLMAIAEDDDWLSAITVVATAS